MIADPDGGYLGRFYDGDRGDVILNPFEPDSVRWNLLGEIDNDYDVDQLARSLITDHGDPDRSWSEYARTFFIAVTQQALASNQTKTGSDFQPARTSHDATYESRRCPRAIRVRCSAKALL